jgi:hypothetical protein
MLISAAPNGSAPALLILFCVLGFLCENKQKMTVFLGGILARNRGNASCLIFCVKFGN